MALEGLRQRPQQIELIDYVAEAIKRKKILCVEAPTGTGKTLAYCLGALEAKENKHVIVISTATTALQEQFFQKDLVLLEKIHASKLSVVLAKGRRRYVCHARLYNTEPFLDDNRFTDKISELQVLLEKNQWQGEFDNAPFEIHPDLSQKISTDSSGCSAGRCEYFNSCVFYQNRRKMHQADIVVTNHSLLLADLGLGGGAILPEIKDSVYILDECHHLPEKALSHFAKQAAVMRSLDWINSVAKALNKAAIYILPKPEEDSSVNLLIKLLVDALQNAQQYLHDNRGRFIEKQWRIKVPEANLLETADTIIRYGLKISVILKNCLSKLDCAYELASGKNDKLTTEAIIRMHATLSFIINRCDNLADIWGDLIQLKEVNLSIPIACWFQFSNDRDENDFTLHTSPINVSKMMQDLFWDKLSNGAILCSATIRAMGKFNDFLRKLGLKNSPHVSEKVLCSPFEYQRSVLFIPQMKIEPSQLQQAKHLEEVLAMLPQLIFSNAGTLILFTSRKAMEFTLSNVPFELRKDILPQDRYSKMAIIKMHKERVNRQERSIIFGLASFAEGVDLPGAYCEHVIIQKIPFSVPSEPISQTRSDWLVKQQKDPFQLMTLPETSVKLAQYMGRLLRHEEDRGVITILDKRLYSKNYGAALLETLPAFTRLVNIPMADFLNHPLILRARRPN